MGAKTQTPPRACPFVSVGSPRIRSAFTRQLHDYSQRGQVSAAPHSFAKTVCILSTVPIKAVREMTDWDSHFSLADNPSGIADQSPEKENSSDDYLIRQRFGEDQVASI